MVPTADMLFKIVRLLLIELQEESNGSPYLFTSRITGGHIVDIRAALRNACKRAGVTKRVTPHLFRHSIATHLLELGYSTRQVQVFLGHKQISQTEWYTQVLDNSKRDIANTLNSLVAPVRFTHDIP